MFIIIIICTKDKLVRFALHARSQVVFIVLAASDGLQSINSSSR